MGTKIPVLRGERQALAGYYDVDLPGAFPQTDEELSPKRPLQVGDILEAGNWYVMVTAVTIDTIRVKPAPKGKQDPVGFVDIRVALKRRRKKHDPKKGIKS